jgi:hypothetical protein
MAVCNIDEQAFDDRPGFLGGEGSCRPKWLASGSRHRSAGNRAVGALAKAAPPSHRGSAAPISATSTALPGRLPILPPIVLAIPVGRRTAVPRPRVIAELVAQPDPMRQLAESIREAEARGDFAALTRPVPEEDDGASEGKLLIRRHVAYERDRALRQRKLDETRRTASQSRARYAASTSHRPTATAGRATSSATTSCPCTPAVPAGEGSATWHCCAPTAIA